MIECDVSLTICDTHGRLRVHMKTVKSRARPRIALLVETSRSYGRELLRGIARFGGTLRNWTLLHQEMSIDETIPHWVNGSNVQGVIARVKQLLSETTMNLDEIAHLAGYRHTEQLSTIFKRETGQTPGQFRRTVADKPVSP